MFINKLKLTGIEITGLFLLSNLGKDHLNEIDGSLKNKKS